MISVSERVLQGLTFKKKLKIILPSFAASAENGVVARGEVYWEELHSFLVRRQGRTLLLPNSESYFRVRYIIIKVM